MNQSNYDVFLGTSKIQLERAYRSYLNQVGVGDYDLPSLTGSKVADSLKKNNPTWSLRSRVKMSYFPYRQVDFVGKSSPPVTRYSPSPDKSQFKNLKYSQGKSQRFSIPQNIAEMHRKVPIQY